MKRVENNFDLINVSAPQPHNCQAYEPQKSLESFLRTLSIGRDCWTHDLANLARPSRILPEGSGTALHIVARLSELLAWRDFPLSILILE